MFATRTHPFASGNRVGHPAFGRHFVIYCTLSHFNHCRAEPVNLVKNPGFEDGEASPKFWDLCDNLTTFWEKDDARGGKCIRMYTNIDVEEFHQRQKEMKLDNPPAPKKPREIKGEGYDTVGGNDGVSFYSEYIDVKPGMNYTLTADVRSEGGSAENFCEAGYTEMPTDIDDHGVTKKIMMKRNSYKVYLNCAGSKTWKENTITFCPTHETDGVKMDARDALRLLAAAKLLVRQHQDRRVRDWIP